MTAISVIIPSRNEGESILRTVQSLVAGRSCAFPLEVVVVDDASTDGSCDGLVDAVGQPENVRVIVRRLDQWSGIPFARNRGAEVATHPTFLITDGNTSFRNNWDLPIRQHRHPGRLLAGTIVDEATGNRGHGLTLVLPSMGVRWLSTTQPFGGFVPVAACGCTVIAADLFRKLGGYDETLPLYGAAEPEFSVRAWLSGYEIASLPYLTVYHRFRPPQDRESFQDTHKSVLLPNYMRFGCYYLPNDLLKVTLSYFAALIGKDFHGWMADLDRQGVWKRRAELTETLPLSFSWLAQKFHLGSGEGNFKA